MNIHQIAAVVLRCTGLCYLIDTAGQLTYLHGYSDRLYNYGTKYTGLHLSVEYQLALVRLVIGFLAGVLLIAFAKQLGKLLTKGLSEDS